MNVAVLAVGLFVVVFGVADIDSTTWRAIARGSVMVMTGIVLTALGLTL